MAHGISIGTGDLHRAGVRTAGQAAGVPWYIWCSAVAVTSAMIGGLWDISWHRSIGRDTFWTPAHMAIYLCGILAGISCGYLILSTTFRPHSAAAGASVRMWGFRGPLGAFIGSWGGVAMLTSAPFDDWWHSAYGLDVKIVSPPHVVLIAGILAVELGALILVLGYMNRSSGALRRTLDWLFLYIGGMILVLMNVLVLEYTQRVMMHSGRFYRTAALVFPAVLVAVAWASQRRWAATTAAGVYTLFWQGMNLILPLFPAEPKLGPVYQQVTHFVPAHFPLLLIVSALALDLLRPRIAGWGRIRQSAAAGTAFLGALLAAQWPFADFLMSPAARNRFFYTHMFDYLTPPHSYSARNLFYPIEQTPAEFWQNMAWAFALAIATAALGLAWAQWMRRIRR